ncbi:hypothetical protein J6590_106893, partial [Homalodisca vitripennis]
VGRLKLWYTQFMTTLREAGFDGRSYNRGSEEHSRPPADLALTWALMELFWTNERAAMAARPRPLHPSPATTIASGPMRGQQWRLGHAPCPHLPPPTPPVTSWSLP